MANRRTPEDEVTEEALRELESLGLSKEALAAAIGRAKLKTSLARRRTQPPPSRPQINTNPDLDTWFE